MRCLGHIFVGLALAILGFVPGARAENGTMPGVKHLALILANADYDADGVIRASPTDQQTPGYLKDLANPCRDAAFFQSSLLAAKWRPEEIIAPPCNQTADQMRTAITAFRKKVADASDTVVIFYFSGHGAQFTSGDTSHSFMFGVGAKFDLKAIAASLHNAPGNTSFDATGAVDLHELTSTLGRQSDNAVLVILDACRDNPLYEEMGEIEAAPAITALSSNTEEYTGVVMAYATPAGQFSGDGFGQHSIYTQAFVSLLTPSRTLDSILNNVEGQVAADYLKAYPTRTGRQEPASRGRFSGDWCLWACPLAAPAARMALWTDLPVPSPVVTPLTLMRIAEQRIGARLQLASLEVSPDPSAASATAPAPPLPTPRRAAAAASPRSPTNRTLFDLEQSDPGLAVKAVDAMRFDLFWCDGDTDAAKLEKLATETGAMLAKEAGKRWQRAERGQLPQLEGSQGLILSVRVRKISPFGNTAGGFRYTQNLVAYDAKRGDEREWASWIAQRAKSRILVSADDDNSPGYMSLAFCQGPAKAASPPTSLYLQVRNDSEKVQGAQLLNGLLATVPRLAVPYPQDVEGGIESRVGPSQTELRYYYPDDRDNVFAAAAAVEKAFGHPVSIQFMPRLQTPKDIAHAEIWIGPNEAGFPNMPHPLATQ